MDGKILARIGAIVFVTLAITAAVLDMARKDAPTADRPASTIGADTPRAAQLRDTIVRCQALGETATRDADCLDAWAENRRRFLGQDEGR